MSDATKNRILVACLMALMIGNMMMMNVASFLPTYVNGRSDWTGGDGTGPTSLEVTLILSIFSVA